MLRADSPGVSAHMTTTATTEPRLCKCGRPIALGTSLIWKTCTHCDAEIVGLVGSGHDSIGARNEAIMIAAECEGPWVVGYQRPGGVRAGGEGAGV